MANTNDSFIEEVTEAVRREQFARWMRRWGWVVGLLLLAIVGGAAWYEWRQSREASLAQLRGDTLLAALEIPDDAERLAALESVASEGEAGTVAALLVAAERQRQGDAAGAAADYAAVAADGAVRPLYRDLAALKGLMAQGAEADRAGYEALAAPGAPFRLLALEQVALLDLAAGERDAAVTTLRSIEADAEASAAQRDRVAALLIALGAPPEEAAPEEAPTGDAAPAAEQGE